MARILLVDDDKVGRFAIRSQLEAAGHDVEEAKEGLHGLRQLRRQGFDLIITDLKMPVMDGLELINEARREFPDIPLIAYTAAKESEMDYLSAATQIGAQAVFRKPFPQTVFMEAVAKALAP